MRLRNNKNAKEILENSSYFLRKPEKNKGMWSKVFQNNNPIHLEIGCGKGQFLIKMAKENPEVNFVGVEKYQTILVQAIKKTMDENLKNLKFICVDASLISDFFAREIETLYLNFSDPWPKTRHAKRRLTSPSFLKEYENLFKNEAVIIQKTDNIKLFAYSLEMYSQNGYILDKVSLDLANEQIDNVETEYEEKFSNLGYKINYVKVHKTL